VSIHAADQNSKTNSTRPTESYKPKNLVSRALIGTFLNICLKTPTHPPATLHTIIIAPSEYHEDVRVLHHGTLGCEVQTAAFWAGKEFRH
jgi:hypothetical protein